jgi:hypothetical protein
MRAQEFAHRSGWERWVCAGLATQAHASRRLRASYARGLLLLVGAQFEEVVLGRWDLEHCLDTLAALPRLCVRVGRDVVVHNATHLRVHAPTRQKEKVVSGGGRLDRLRTRSGGVATAVAVAALCQRRRGGVATHRRGADAIEDSFGEGAVRGVDELVRLCEVKALKQPLHTRDGTGQPRERH